MRRIVSVLLLLTGCLAAGCEVGAPARVAIAPNSAAGEVAFELQGPGGAALVVPVRVNGAGPFDFVLDTGATFTCLDRQLADSLALPEQRGVVGTGVTIGGGGVIRLVSIDSLRVGGARAYDLGACVLDLQQMRAAGLDVRGLLGLNFLKSFRVGLDFDRKLLTLDDPRSP